MIAKLYVLPLVMLMTQAHAGKIDFSAGEGIKYHSVIIKLKASEKNTLKTSSSISSLSTILKQEKLTAESLFYPGNSGNKLLKTAKPDALAIKNGLDRYLHIDIPVTEQGNAKYINLLMGKLSKQEQVELVYPDATPMDLALSATAIPNFSSQQYYFNAPEDKKTGYVLGGLNIVAADSYEGGRGENISFISMEVDPWFTENTNLPANAYPNVSSKKQNGSQAGDHDTASVGIMVGKNLGYGIVGAAYNAKKISYVRNSQELIALLPNYAQGDVIQVGMATLIPKGAANCTADSGCGVPMEYLQAYYDAYKMATEKGIHVIEGSGNHSINLDHAFFDGKFDRKVRDPGTILVGAVCGKDGKKAYFSSYGSAIDVSAWGCFDIASTGYGDLFTDGNTSYTAKYSGTSAANPQIAGLVANISGIAKKQNKMLTPVTMRNLLQVTGTKIAGEENVGYYPNLKSAADYVVNFKK